MRPGLALRLIIAAAVALFGVVSYYRHSQVNAVTGETQRVALTVDEEKALGLNAAPEMAARMGGEVSKSDPDEILVSDVGARIVRSSDAARGPYHYDFHVLNDPRTVNAFALPGGQIFITRGLLSRLETEAQLATVLAHEIGHVVNRHAAEHLAKAQLSDNLSIAVGVGASGRGGGRFSQAISQVVGSLMQLKYSREDELEADKFGLLYSSQAGFDPGAMLGVMDILAKAAPASGQSEIMATHPRTESRIEAIRAWLKEHYPAGVPKSLAEGRPLR
jgi:predicted Zn-dependent protease